MNQILLTDTDNNKKKNNSKNNRSNSNDIRKIIMFFSIVILVFGVAIGGVYGYRIIKNSKGKEVIISEPKLSLQSAEEGAEEVVIIAESEVGISKIIYTWNNEEEVIKELSGRTKQEEIVEIPFGENTLKVKVVDLNGKEKKITEEFSRIEEYSDKIEINTSIVDNKIKIVATSELPISYLTYRWNEEEETKIEAQSENEFSIETIIDVKRGANKITITAKDNAGNSNSIDKNFDGRLKPEINVYIENNRLYMKIAHDMGFEKVEFYVNGTTYTYDQNFSGYDQEKEQLEYYFELIEGENVVAIIAVSREDTREEYVGKYNYTVQ